MKPKCCVWTQWGAILAVFGISALFPMTGAQVNSSDIDQMIANFKQDIQNEKDNAPKTIRLKWEQQPFSINAAVEDTADTQRYFEYIANKTDMLSLNPDQRKKLQKALDGSQAYQNLLQQCKSKFPQPQCDKTSKYRTYDGTCNNLRNTTWGSLFHCHRRLLPQNYVGLSGFRQSVRGGPLPDPRDLSLNIVPNVDRPTPYLSHMFTFYGQLLTHDITDTALTKVNGHLLMCCPQVTNSTYQFPECAPLLLRPDDPFYSQPNINQRCLQFTRHVPCRTCDFTKREQMNSVTAYIDTHFTYGRTQTESDSLRANDGTGRLLTQDSSSGPLMPPNISEDDLFCVGNFTSCFRGGDSRTNQHSVLMALQILFLREHNRMATRLQKINPLWDDKTIYQTARKILGAKMQVIAFKEYLPLLLGDDLMTRYGLWIGSQYKYDSNVDATISTEFQSFAFRLHSFTNSQVGNLNCSRTMLRNLLRDPTPIHQGCAGDFLQGTCRTSSQKFDRFFVQDLTNFNNRIPGQTFGADLAAASIKRGRDDGVACYADVVEYLSHGDIKIRSFNDLRGIMPASNIKLLQNNYADVRDIDAWVGIHLEDILEGTQVSSAAAYIIAEQFQRLKKGDRFYFENAGQPWSFNKYQIRRLRKTTLSRMICDNTEAQEMPVNAQLKPNQENPMVPCDQLESVNLMAWKE